MAIERRQVLFGVTISLGASCVSARALDVVGAKSRAISPAALAELARGLFEDLNSAVAIGRAAIAQEPTLASPSAVLQALQVSLNNRVSNQIDSTEYLRERISRQIRTDFEAGSTYRIEGWVLAQTEVRICVLLTPLGIEAS